MNEYRVFHTFITDYFALFMILKLIARHQQEMDELSEHLETDKQRRLLILHERLAENRRRRMEDLGRKQDAELTNEMLEQRKELDEIRLKHVRRQY